MHRANLQFTDLYGADLAHADLSDVIFDVDTTLPDRTRWTPDIDIARFTDPNHLDFWRSDDPESPAYRGAGEDDGDATGDAEQAES